MSTQDYVAAQNGAVRLATRDLLAFWRLLDHEDIVGVRIALESFWPELLATYGEVTATLAADRFEDLTGLSATMVRPVDPERANARMRWAVEPLAAGATGSAEGRLAVLLDELVKQPGRSTMIASTRDNSIRYARVPTGAETCAFCLMLASRGAVYVSERSASTKASGGKFHGKCDCRTEPVRDDTDLERLKTEGYDPEDLYDRYMTARHVAGGDTKDILSAMRAMEDIN